MKLRHWFTAASLALGVVAAPMVILAADTDKEANTQPEVPAEVKPAEPAKKHYWLGVQLAPTPEILKRHVERLKDGAAMVAGVATDSPAMKAGLKPGDHILKINDTVITQPAQVIDLVRSSDGEALSMRVLRGMDIESLTVNLEEAPADLLNRQAPIEQPQIIGIEPDQMGQPNAKFRFFGPGQVVPHQLRMRIHPNDLPENMTIRVEKKDNEPAKIHIEKDGKSWDVTSDSIDQLPEDLQPIAKQYLANNGPGQIIVGGQNVPFIQMQEMIKNMAPGVPQIGPNGQPVLPNADMMQKQMQRDIQQMREMMQQLHKQMEQMQQQQPAKEPVKPNEV